MTDRVDRPGKLSRSTVAFWACLALILCFQTQLVPFFSAGETGALWKVTYYGFWLAIFAATIFAWHRTALPAVVLCGACACLALLYPISIITKNWLVAMGLIAFLQVLAPVAGIQRTLRVCAGATAFTAIVCLIDILFVQGLSNTSGRAAGIHIGPNVAAIALLLGAAVSWSALSAEIAVCFVLLVGAAILVTLSKSVLLVYIAIFSAVAIFHYRPIRLTRPIVTAAVLMLWIFVALTINPSFVTASASSVTGIVGALPAFERAKKAVAAAAARQEVKTQPQARAQAPAPASPASASKPSMPSASTAPLIRELERRADTEGYENSISARWLLLEMGWLVYLDHPWFGIGLDGAHALKPHNTFLLLALAFGIVGWLLPLVVLWGLWPNGSLTLATLATFMVSHDLMVPALLVPIALGLAIPKIGRGTLRLQGTDENDSPNSPRVLSEKAQVDGGEDIPRRYDNPRWVNNRVNYRLKKIVSITGRKISRPVEPGLFARD